MKPYLICHIFTLIINKRIQDRILEQCGRGSLQQEINFIANACMYIHNGFQMFEKGLMFKHTAGPRFGFKGGHTPSMYPLLF